MDIYLVFNELSAEDGAKQTGATEYTAREWMSKFARIISYASRSNFQALKTYDDFFGTELVPGYTIRDWLKKHPDIDLEEQRRVRTAGTKYTCLSRPPSSSSHDKLPVDIQTAESRMLEFEFKCGGRAALGLGSSYLLESVAVSLCTTESWHVEEVGIEIEQFDEDNDDIVEKTDQVKHICALDHVDMHRSWSQERLTTSVRDGIYLDGKCKEWYPNLIFIEEARQQIRNMTSGTPQLRQVTQKLFELENYCSTWITGGFDKNALASKASPESDSVRKNPDLYNRRVFKLPNGEEQFFEWHLRLTPDSWRLHFYPDANQNKIYIGYIGKKLPTAKYRT